ncbi:MAG: hypothetical protein K2X29_05315, partial [Candidatus Obscuribacterales bacterium]|nr:hypothetical protein [Candidatus Obscuribacterales bacterium]
MKNMIARRLDYSIVTVAALAIIAVLAIPMAFAQTSDSSSMPHESSDHQSMTATDRDVSAQDQQQQSSQQMYPPEKPAQVQWQQQQPQPTSIPAYPPI